MTISSETFCSHSIFSFRLIQCLVALDSLDRATVYLNDFRLTFPAHADSAFLVSVDADIAAKQKTGDSKLPQAAAAAAAAAFGGGEGGRKRLLWTVPVEEVDSAVDFTRSFCGHCNTTTDIKEANFLGR